MRWLKQTKINGRTYYSVAAFYREFGKELEIPSAQALHTWLSKRGCPFEHVPYGVMKLKVINYDEVKHWLKLKRESWKHGRRGKVEYRAKQK